MNNKVTYRQQFTRCGKERCRKCREGDGHGPYWYAYWSEKGRTVSKYIGTRLPEHLAASANGENDLAPSLEQSEVSGTQGRSTPILRLYLLGQFRIEHWKETVGVGLASTPVLHGEWQAADSRTSQRRRTRALLGCLLSSPSRRMGREQVMDMLWPDLDIDVAANRLNGAVHELRQILEPDISRPSSSRLLRLERDMLELADSTLIWVDAEAFEQLLKDAERCTDIREAERLLEEAAALYQGNYLPEEMYSEWAIPRRDTLQRAWAGLQLRLVQIKVAQGAYVSAIDNLNDLRTADPTNETALQQLMILLTHQKRRAEALQIYKQFREMLLRDYEGEPLPATIELYEKLRKGHIPPLFSTNVGAGSAQGASSVQGAGSAQGTIPTESEETDDSLSYTRPIFQPGHQSQSPLIGREQEQQRMRQLLLTIEQQAGEQTSSRTETPVSSPLAVTDSLQPGPTHFLLLRGEPGIGKTRMVEELSLEAYDRGWTVAWSRSYEQESAMPYHPWTEILRTLLHNDETVSELLSTVGTGSAQGMIPTAPVRALLPELADHGFSAQPSPGVSHEQKRLQLWEATLGLLTTLSKFHPLLLVFDDLHWADDSSIELLTYVTHHLQEQPVLLIGTCRDGELAPQHKLRSLTAELQRHQAMTLISAHPLTQSQIGTLLSHLPEQLISSIQSQSSGNPFFAEELARSLYRGGAGLHPDEQEQLDAFFLTQKTEQENVSSSIGVGLGQGSAQGTIPTALPDAIAAVLERRLHRLSNGCHTLLSKAAVLGDSFKLEQLPLMAPEHNEDTILDLLEEALHAGLLIEEGTGANVIYHFRHPLIMSYLYNHLSAARRAQLHRRASALSATSKGDSPESNRHGNNIGPS